MTKSLSYRLQAFTLHLLFGIFSILKPRHASQLGGNLLVFISPILKKQNDRIKANLDFVYPDQSDDEKNTIRHQLWRHLGMNLGEYPHLIKAYNGHPDFNIEVKGMKNLNNKDQATVFISAHIGNWEMLPLTVAKYKRPFHALFRPPNNSHIRQALENFRTLNGALPPALTKGRQGFVALAKKLKEGEDIGILLDQKHSGGVNVPLFDQKATTSIAPIELALKYNAPIILGRVIRHGPCDFTLEVLKPLDTENKSATDIMNDIHKYYETWINEHPAQWLWMHRRWGKL